MALSLNDFLLIMIEKKGSDLFVSSQLPVSAKINGELTALSDDRLTDEQSLELVESAMSEKQKAEIRKRPSSVAIAKLHSFVV